MHYNKFYRHFPTKGISIYWILFVYIVLGAFFPVMGFVAIVCMIAPVAVSVRRGRWWCGNACPRGNMFDRLISKYSTHRSIPAFLRSKGWRVFMLCFIFGMFGMQMYFAWGDWQAMGRVFWTIITVTTIVGLLLAFVYAPRTWCSFCPMGTLSSWVAPKKGKLPAGYKCISVSGSCRMKCKSCARVCPMQLAPYDCRGKDHGYLHPDCLKCGKCIQACPLKIVEMQAK